ncbi:Heterokaryon incompatibility protein 6,OR allele, partial [Lachnellula hyalina]
MSVCYPQRLQPRHVRFLKLLSGLESEPIQCELVESGLDNALGFEALSYVWGDPKIRQEIQCEGSEFSITANLYQALQHLRQSSSARLIWADAICINQDGIEERNQQVQLMREIYSRASRVVVWLGLEYGEDVTVATSLMRTIYAACSKHAEIIDADLITLAVAYQGLNGVTPDQLERLGDHCSPKHPRSWPALRNFFARPWFTRVWCIQEIVLARDSIVLVGEDSISWNMVGVTACWLTGQMSESDFDGPSHLDDISYYNAYCMFDDGDKDELGLLQILAKYRDFESTDPKDKVYGLL